MSHTRTHGATTFVGNSDLSGTVEIMTESGRIEVPGQDILEFVAGHVARERIAQLEQADHAAILGIPVALDARPANPYITDTHKETHMAHVLQRLAAHAADTPLELTEHDLWQLQEARIVFFRERVEGIRRMNSANTISAHFKRVHVEDQIRSLKEQLGDPLPTTFADHEILDEKVHALTLVEGWFKDARS